MVKPFLKYLLFLCVLLLSVHSQIYAQSSQEFSRISLAKVSNGSELASYGAIQADQPLKVRYFSPSSGDSFKLEATDIEEEEDEFVSIQKFLESNNYLAASLYALILAFFFRYIKRSLLFCKQISYNSSLRRYLIFQVFRI
ncbi:hypothetical protein [Pontibacter saemangeumensis]|uniref:hypothetical protein n=1 Tax=Pontibacter saemangeumensis TaxID=1084525 RepID=UPI0031ED7AF4